MARRWFLSLFIVILLLLVLGVGLVGFAVVMTYPRLPSLEVLTSYRPKMPLRVYTADGVQIGEFGEERRAVVKIGDVPEVMKRAVLAAEDERFYEHGGIDYIGVIRAMVSNVTAGQTRSGASTITMQVAKNFFLSSERTFSRKFNEALLSFKIENSLSKNQILEVYFNQIYLGQRAYGFASAAQVYFGKELKDISIAEAAMLAGLPKAPSSYNPVVNPERARQRQLYILRRMHDLGYLSAAQYEQSKEEKLNVIGRHTPAFRVKADYLAEMVRQMMFERYKEAAYTEGFKVYTTLSSVHQAAANEALRKGVLEYDRRHGYRGPEGFIDSQKVDFNQLEELADALSEYTDDEIMQAAVVLEASPTAVSVYTREGEKVTVQGAGLRFAQRYLQRNANPATKIRRGAVIRVQKLEVKGEDRGWEIVQMPQVEAALVSVNPDNGAIKSLVGGFDFNRGHFNHVVQAWRQPGSSFKPFVYSAGIEKGFTPATVMNDAPLEIDPATIGGQQWSPKNYDGKFSGPMTIRQALTRSKNLISIRILQAITPQYAQNYIQRFGFSPKQHPAYLTMSLGAGMVTPLQMAEGYCVFANGGYRVNAFFVDRIEDNTGRVLARTTFSVAGQDAPQVLDPRNAFIMTSMMRDVIRSGTATQAMKLGRQDLSGKTGTTNDQHDAWFAGYQRRLVAVAWIGFDQPRSLGGSETGGIAALPIWIHYMGKSLKGVPQEQPKMPAGVLNRGGEYFYQEYPVTNPNLKYDAGAPVGGGNAGEESGIPLDEVRDMLF